MNFKPLPEVGKIYNYFDDGKINRSRLFSVIIDKIVPYADIRDEEILSQWKEEIAVCDWLYATETDVFIKATLFLTSSRQEIVFVRTKDGGFFSLGWWGGRLDVDNEIIKSLENYENSEY